MRVLFLGRLEDVAGAAQMDIALAAPTALADVLALLPVPVAQALAGPRIRLAVNGTLVGRDGLVLDDADELALLPPVSGG